jgi:hypothetical protein
VPATETRAARYRVLGCNDEQTVCDFCARDHLKKTVILEDATGGDIVRVGTTCAVRACAVPGVRTRAQLDRKVAEVTAVIASLEYRIGTAVAVLADPDRLRKCFDTRANAPHGPGYRWSIGDEQARWEAELAAHRAELARRTGRAT